MARPTLDDFRTELYAGDGCRRRLEPQPNPTD